MISNRVTAEMANCLWDFRYWAACRRTIGFRCLTTSERMSVSRIAGPMRSLGRTGEVETPRNGSFELGDPVVAQAFVNVAPIRQCVLSRAASMRSGAEFE